jgi:hypothetical protein
MSVTSRQHALQIGSQRIHTPQAQCGESACLIPPSASRVPAADHNAITGGPQAQTLTGSLAGCTQRRLAHSVVWGA